MAKDFSYYFAQLRKTENHRSKEAEKEIRKLYKGMLADAKHFVAEEYYKLAEDGKLTYEILRANGRDARFLEEIEQQLTGVSREVSESIRKAAEDVYRLAYDGMIEATQKGVKGFSGLGGATDEMIKAAVNNPIATTALEKNYKDTVWDIKRQIATGLMTGDRYDTMAKRMAKSLDMDYKKAVRIVRTETGRVREAGHLQSAKNVNDSLKQGTTNMRLTKTWKTMRDERVRSSHQSMNGVTVAMDEDFTLPDGTKTQAPKQSGVASQDINCRCYVSYKLMSDAEFYAATGKHLVKVTEEPDTFAPKTATELAKKWNIEKVSDFDEEVIGLLDAGMETFQKYFPQIKNCNLKELISSTAQRDAAHFFGRGIAINPNEIKRLRRLDEIEELVSTMRHEETHWLMFEIGKRARRAGIIETVDDVDKLVRKETLARAGLKASKENVQKNLGRYATTSAQEFCAVSIQRYTEAKEAGKMPNSLAEVAYQVISEYADKYLV